MKKQFASLVLIASASVLTFASPAKAEQVCQVTDPTGTPLNVRNYPNGEIVNALRNGREVEILEIANDEQGRAWARIAGYYEGEYRVWGWVIREFISCYNR
ncbi:MAG: SH3 domain-containing protein [Oculatellaceae cyanobacterium Prado106]|nr:SH3 domain-containing protein [Oculatellaceae cyanobacterium Prado106]